MTDIWKYFIIDASDDEINDEQQEKEGSEHTVQEKDSVIETVPEPLKDVSVPSTLPPAKRKTDPQRTSTKCEITKIVNIISHQLAGCANI